MAWKEYANYWIMMQTQGYSCGMACVCMVIRRRNGGQPSEDLVVSRSKKKATGYGQALADRFKGPRMLAVPGAQPMSSTDSQGTDRELGTEIHDVAELLTEWQVPNNCTKHVDIMGQLRNVRSGSPAIAHIAWNGGGGHFVLIEKYMPGPKGLIICDPIDGLVSMDANGGNAYAAKGGGGGRFSGWLITT